MSVDTPVDPGAPALEVCVPKQLPREQWVAAAEAAARINPANRLTPAQLRALAEPPRSPTSDGRAGDDRLALLVAKYWGAGGVRLTVGFLDNPPAELRAKILAHMNAWNVTANVQFTETLSLSEAQVRIARTAGRGHYSWPGTDILLRPPGAETMNLASFTMATPDAEFFRVVRHETGHTLGFPHEHMRKEVIDRIDRQKAVDYFMRTQGWTEQEVVNQILTPLEESSILGSATADQLSIMCYQLPGALTKDGRPILGGTDIDATDRDFIAQLYPKTAS